MDYSVFTLDDFRNFPTSDIENSKHLLYISSLSLWLCCKYNVQSFNWVVNLYPSKEKSCWHVSQDVSWISGYKDAILHFLNSLCMNWLYFIISYLCHNLQLCDTWCCTSVFHCSLLLLLVVLYSLIVLLTWLSFQWDLTLPIFMPPCSRIARHSC